MGLFATRRRPGAHTQRQGTFPLSEGASGDQLAVADMRGSTRLNARLRELGVVPGVAIRVLRDSCPLIIQVGESRLSLRREDAAAIQVLALSDPVAVAATLEPALA